MLAMQYALELEVLLGFANAITNKRWEGGLTRTVWRPWLAKSKLEESALTEVIATPQYGVWT